jgi:hypothetical protein
MDEDEVYEEYIESEPAMTPTKLKWIDPVIVLVQVVEELITAVADGFGNFKMLLVHHANYKINRERFAAEASRELEVITEGPKED